MHKDKSLPRFVLVGLLNTLVGLLVILGAKALLGWPDLPANALGYVVGLLVGFQLNRTWTFEFGQHETVERLCRYFAVFLFAYSLNLLALFVARDGMHLNSYVAQILTVPVYTLFFYLLSRVWVFRKESVPLKTGQLAVTTAGLLTALAIPLGMTRIAPMGDHLNHLARTYIAHNMGRTPGLADYYVFEWKLLPNIGFDVVIWGLNLFISDIYLAGQLFLGLTLVVLVSGALVLHRALHQRWSFSPLIVGLFAYHACFTYGFTAFSLGVGLALWAAAAWVALENAHVLLRLVCGTLLCGVLYACHLFGFGFYGIIIGSIALYGVWRAFRGEDDGPTWRVASVGLALAVVQAIPWVVWHLQHASQAAVLLSPWSVLDLILGLRMPVWSHWLPWRVAMTLVFPLFGAAWALGWAQIDRRVAPALVGLLILWLIVPIYVADTLFVGQRFPILFCILFSSIWSGWDGVAAHRKRLVMALGVGCMVIQTGVTAYAWRAYQPMGDELLAVMNEVPEGAHLESVWHEDWLDWTPPPLDVAPRLGNPGMSALVHAASLATIEANAFVPTHFTHHSKQLLKVTPPYESIARSQGMPLFLGSLFEALPAEASVFEHPKLALFSHILVVHADAIPADILKRLEADVKVRGQWVWLLERPAGKSESR